MTTRPSSSKSSSSATAARSRLPPPQRSEGLEAPEPSGSGVSGAKLNPMRICLVTPFAWSQPHDVNEHVAGVAKGLRALGHEATVLAPSTRAVDLLAGRRALLRG